MTTLSSLRDMKVAVWGGGRDGKAAATSCLAQGCTVTIVSDEPDTDEASRRTAEELTVPLRSASELATMDIDFLVRSPGISRYRPEVISLAKRSVPSSNLFALWLADQPADKVIGITGTKGKSTTATAIRALLTAMGMHAELGGNIGVPVTQLDPGADVFVVEVSSYQASDCTTSPGIGVMTALGQDHITWHGTLAQYHRDKINLFAHEQLRHMVFHPDDTVVSRALSTVGAVARHRPARLTQEHLEKLAEGSGVFDRMGRTTFPQNFLLAVTAVEATGHSPTDAQIAAALRTIAPLASRQDIIGEVHGIEFIDDALASNPMAARAAIERFDDRPCVLILGGSDRNVDHGELIEAINGSSHVRQVVVMGPPGDSLAERIAPRLNGAVRTGSFDLADAVSTALRIAELGWRIIFSPAAPTPAQSGDYRARSDAFREAMNRASSIS